MAKAWDDAVVTNVGKAMIAELFPGEKPYLDWATGGAGTVSPVSLMAQTAVSDQRQTFPIVGVTEEDNGKKVAIQITNNGLEIGYTVKQIGIWAHAGESQPILYAILQDTTGFPILSETDFPDFALNFHAVLDFSNEADFDVVVDTAALVSMGTLQNLLDAAAAAAQADLDNHAGDKANPHEVTAAQVGAAAVGDAIKYADDISEVWNHVSNMTDGAAKVMDLDELTQPGFYAVSGSSTNVPPSKKSQKAGNMLVMPYRLTGSIYPCQVYCLHGDYSNPEIWLRMYHGTEKAWRPWTMLRSSTDAIPPGDITQDAGNRFVTDTEKATWNAKAPTASPGFTGTPTAPTPGNYSESTQLATTAFVKNQFTAGAGASMPTEQGNFTPTLMGTSVQGSFTYSTRYGCYYRIGHLVIASVSITVDGISQAPTGTLVVSGMPFSPSPAGWYVVPLDIVYFTSVAGQKAEGGFVFTTGYAYFVKDLSDKDWVQANGLTVPFTVNFSTTFFI